MTADPDHELHARIRQVMLRLNHHHLEYRHGIEGRATALAAAAIAERAGQKRPETLKLHRARQNLERIAVLAQPVQVLRPRKQAARVGRNSPFNALE